MATNQFSLLKKQQFLPLFITQFFATFNNNAFKNALSMFIAYSVTAMNSKSINPQVFMALATGLFVLPFFLFSATAGQLADKYEKSSLIRVIKFLEIILAILATLGFYWKSIPLLLVTIFLMGTQAAFFGPLKYAILPNHLLDTELIAGNGLIEAGTFLAILLGTIVGGKLILYPLIGSSVIAVLLCLIAVSGFLISLFIPQAPPNKPNLIIKYNFFTETFYMIKYAKGRRDIFLCILGISWFWLIGATFLTEFPGFTKDNLHAGENVVIFFLALFSIGIAIGSLFCNKLLKGKIHAKYVPVGAFGMTLFTIDLYFCATHGSGLAQGSLINLAHFLHTLMGWRITIDLLLIAVCGGLYTVPLYTILQYRSDEAYRARIIASNNIMNALFMALASLATILMLKLGLTISQIFLCIAIGNAMVAIYIYKLVKFV